MSQPLPADIASRLATIIADGHAYERHVGNARMGGVRADKPGEGFGDMSREEFREKVKTMLMDPNLKGFRHNDGSWTFILPKGEKGRDVRLEVDFSPRGQHGAYDLMTTFPMSGGKDTTQDLRMARDRSASNPRAYPYLDNNALRQALPDLAPRLASYERDRNRHFEQKPRGRAASDIELAGSQDDVTRYRRQQANLMVQAAAHTEAPHSDPSAPRRPTLTVRPRIGGAVGVIAGTVVTTAASAQEIAVTQGRKDLSAMDYAKAAWEQTLVAPATQGRYAETVLRTLEVVDPTLGVLTGGMRSQFRRMGADVDPSMFEGLQALSGSQKAELKRNLREIGYLNREQFATLQSAGLTEIRDDKGKRVDVAEILRDTARREIFMNNLTRAHEQEKNPDEKRKLADMIDASYKFLGHEPRRDAVLASTERILGRAQAPAAQAAVPQQPESGQQRPPSYTS